MGEYVDTSHLARYSYLAHTVCCPSSVLVRGVLVGNLWAFLVGAGQYL